MSGAAIAIVGGGVYVVRLCQMLAAHPTIPLGEIRLIARRYDRLCVIAAECQRVVDLVVPGWKVRAARSLEEGCAGARMVILLLREGGLAARARDESFPRAFGLAGDEGLGPGGMANALRTIPALRGIAEVIARVAPDAWVLNMVAPLGVTTRFVLDSGLHAIGVCELPAVTERRLLAAARLPHATLSYAGFNHLGWFWAAGKSGTDLARTSAEARLSDRDTVAVFGAVPLRYYYEIFEPEKAERLGFHRSPSRADELNALSERLFASFPMREAAPLATFEERPTPWFDEALIPIVGSLTAGGVFDGFLNLRNEHRLPVAPEDVVVEVRARISGGVIETFEGGTPPAKVASFLAAVGRSEEFVYCAAITGDANEKWQAIASAIEVLPLPSLSGKLEDLVDEIINAAAE